MLSHLPKSFAKVSFGTFSPVLSLSLALLIGCGSIGTPVSSFLGDAAITGRLYTSTHPIAGSSVQLYAAGTTGTASAAQPLLSEAITSDAGGNFNIPAGYRCSSSESELYLVARGGTPEGLGSENAALSLVALLGPCGNQASLGPLTVNEVTTLASVASVPSYMTSLSQLGANAQDTAFFPAVEQVQQFANLQQGVTPGAVPAGFTVPSDKINTLANILAGCNASFGGKAGDGTLCGDLFTLTTPASGTAPTDTATSALMIVRNPTLNVQEIYALSQSGSHFQPSLTSAPESWALAMAATTNSPSAPSFSPGAGSYGIGQTVAISSGSGASINYTLDGSTPTSSSPVYTGPLTLNASETITAIATSHGVSSKASAAAYSVSQIHLAFASQPGTAAVNTVFSPVPQVKVLDAQGNPVTGAVPVTLSLGTNPGSATLGGTTTVSASKGVAAFSSVSLSAAGTGYTFVASSPNTTPVSSDPFNVTLPPLFINVAGSTVTEGETEISTISISQPAPADVPVTLTSQNPNYVSVPTGTVTIPAGQKSAVYNYTGVGAGIATLQVSAPGYAPYTRRVSGLPLAPIFSPAAGSYTAGQTVTLSSDPGMVIHYTTDGSKPGNNSPVYTKPLSINASETIQAYATGNYVTSPLSTAAYTVGSTLVFSTQPPSATTVRTPLTPVPTVQVVDATGNVLAVNTPVTLSLASNPGKANLLGSTTVNAVNGVATFPGVSLDAAGSGYALAATTTNAATATSNPFSVTAPSLALNVSASTVSTGGTVTGTVSLSQTSANPVTVALSSSAPAAVTVAPATLNIPAGQSSASYSFSGAGAGTATLTATAQNYTSASQQVSALPAAPALLPMAGTYPAGQSITLSAAAGAAIHYTTDSSTPTATSALYTTQIVLNANETVNAIAIQNGTSSPVATAAYTVAPHLAFTVQPASSTVGTILSPSPAVQMVDVNGNAVAINAPVTLTLTSNPGGATLAGSTTVNAVNGLATFPNLSLNAPGSGYILSAASPNTTSATSNSFSVASLTLSLTVSAPTVSAGGTVTGTVSLSQASANPVTVTLSSSATAAVTVAPATLNIPAGQTSASYSFSGAGAGTATLTATAQNYTSASQQVSALPASPAFLPAAGTYPAGQSITLSAPAGAAIHFTTDGSAPGASSTLYTGPIVLNANQIVNAIAIQNGTTSPAVNAAYTVAPHLVFTVQPANSTVGTILSPAPAVQVVDVNGNPVPVNAPITLTLTSNPGSTTLSGTTTVTASNGVAMFPNLSLNAAGSGYTLSATSPNTTPVVSSLFSVNASQPGLSVTVTSATVNTGSTLRGTITLAQPATTYLRVNLSTASSSTLTVAPASVVIAPGASTAPFLYTGVAAGATDLSASASGYATGSTSVVVATAQPTHTYYVSNSGNDSNDGSTPSTAWQTLAKVSATRLSPGMVVSLECGSTFRETLTITQSGVSNSPISYKSYGNCTGSNLPMISGADLLSGWTAAAQGSYTAYYASEATTPAAVFEDNHRLAAAASLTALKTGSYFYDSANHRVYVVTRENGAPGSHVMEASVRQYDIKGIFTNYIVIDSIEADKASLDGVLFAGTLTNVSLTNMVTNYCAEHGIYFSANTGQAQNNLLMSHGTANYNSADGVDKGNGGNNVVISNYKANYNSFDPRISYSGGIRLISDGTTDANRVTFSGVELSSADFNGINPDTGAQIDSSTGSGVGIWCDTCGNGSFLTGNEGHGNTQAGVELEWTGANGSLSMTYNTEWNNFYGVLHSRKSHNDYVSNNTTWNNFINCQFSGQYGGGETIVGMVNNTYENNICGTKAANTYGSDFVAKWGAENNSLGEGSRNVYKNNSFGDPSTANGVWVTFGVSSNVKSYAALDALYGSSTSSVQANPMLKNPNAGDFSLMPGSPAIGTGVGGVDLGAVPYNKH